MKKMPNPKFNDEIVADRGYGSWSGLEDINEEDAVASVAINVCQNCGTGRGPIEQIWTDDGTKPLLCEDCAAEVRRLEKRADELAAAPGCPHRQQIVDTAESTAELVNRLLAHDMADCVGCSSVRRQGKVA